MKNIHEFVDRRNKCWCIHCGAPLFESETNRDHSPSKSLLKYPYPENVPTVEICMSCNSGFSEDEEYMAVFLACVEKGSTDPEKHDNPKIKRALLSKPNLLKIIEDSRVGGDNDDTQSLYWRPVQSRIHNVVLKNARGHAYHEYGEPLLNEPTHIRTIPLLSLTDEQLYNFEKVYDCGILPEIGSRMMTRVFTGQDLCDGWVIVQPNVYRYSVTQQGVMLVRSVINEYLATEVYWADY